MRKEVDEKGMTWFHFTANDLINVCENPEAMRKQIEKKHKLKIFRGKK